MIFPPPIKIAKIKSQQYPFSLSLPSHTLTRQIPFRRKPLISSWRRLSTPTGAMQQQHSLIQIIQGESSQQATNQVLLVATTRGIQSQNREGSVKKCKKRATKRQPKHKLRQHAIDAGGVAFIAIENCAICKAKHLNARGIKTRIPKRSHHKAGSKNLKTRGTSEMTVFVNKEAARNLAANRAAISNKAVNKSQKDISST